MQIHCTPSRLTLCQVTCETGTARSIPHETFLFLDMVQCIQQYVESMMEQQLLEFVPS
jgi:hypothetical protein